LFAERSDDTRYNILHQLRRHVAEQQMPTVKLIGLAFACE
jgi:hypothetical protein